MKKLIICLAAMSAVLLSACSNIPNKSVTEELSTEELAKAIKSDSLFAEVYEFSRFRMALSSEVERAQLSEISYRRALDYAKFIDDNEYWDKQKENFGKEWEKQNEELLAKTDSVIAKTRTDIGNSKIYDNVKLELKEVQKKPVYFLFSSTTCNLGFTFDLTPLNGTINEIDFAYGFVNTYRPNETFEFLATKRLRNQQFSEPTTIEGRNVTLGTATAPTKEQLLSDMGFIVIPLEIVKGSDTISINANDIAQNVLKCVCINKAKFPKVYDFHRQEALKELFPTEYTGKATYVNKRVKDVKKEKDPLCYDFFLVELDN